ncbi:alpha-mannosidase [Paenibacillus humicola]|uniref:alpha-mannosidase n=1 Tax=Paenibacillus humicola TaxID=3110540 RepID=UPI00237A2B2B|nr:alpha-mannosidase [Paenibacillus humicola]
MSGRKAHIISHTHWDREWYLPYEKHHVRLVALMDTLLDTMEREPEYRSFYLDGQTAILEDYLQVRPENRERLEALIRAGRIVIGPWYILQDAFLTSGEANVRNMQIGHRDALRYGRPAKVGYFPDTFGNIGQAPQLMLQAGIDNAVFGRGVKPTGFNNTIADAEYESSFSELVWEGPDGSQVLGILFANWYSNGNEVPADEAEAQAFWERKLADAEKYASTGELLFMNGCDHQPIQTDLPEAIRMARKLFPDTEFVHSNFSDYLAAVRGAQNRPLSVVKGELRSQRTDGWSTLVNTASARVYLKQMNQRGQALLERAAEPLASMASALGGAEYPHHLFTYAWKTLMQNHPHDSICGCSVDEVHQEMVTRFAKSRHVAETIVDDSKRALAEAVDTSGFSKRPGAVPFVVFNTSGTERSGTVEVELDAERIYFRDGIRFPEMNRRLEALDLSGRVLVSDKGETAACTVEDLGLQFGYDLPDDRFRQPYMCRRVKLTFAAEGVPALGWASYAWAEGGAAADKAGTAGEAGASGEPTASAGAAEEAGTSGKQASVPVSPAAHTGGAASLVDGERVLDNGRIRVEAAADGSLTLTDRASGRTYRDLLVFEDTGDIGNEYMYRQPDGETPLTTKGMPASVRVVEDTPYRAALEIVHEWKVPAGGDETFEREKREVVYFPYRRGKRVSELVPLTLKTIVRLERGGKGVDFEVSFDNRAKDHRIRALFPTDLQAARHRADSIFEVAVRDTEPAAEWENPSNCQHQQAFVDVSEAEAGLTVANLGLNEYEILRDGRNTIAVTLLRAVGELGDWGVFPTPEAQCIGQHTARMRVLPHGGDDSRLEAYADAYQYQTPWTVCQTGVHRGKLASSGALLEWTGAGLAFSSLTRSPETGDLMLRWFNMMPEVAELSVCAAQDLNIGGFYKSGILEQRGDALSAGPVGGRATLAAGPCEIVTLGAVCSKS